MQAKEEHPDATEDVGPWLFTLDFPSYMPIMTHATNRCVCVLPLYLLPFPLQAFAGDCKRGLLAAAIKNFRLSRV